MKDFKEFLKEHPILMETLIECLVTYKTNGDIDFEPNELSREMHITTDDKPVSLEGKILLYPSGKGGFKHYQRKPKNETLATYLKKTKHGNVRDDGNGIIIRFRFPKTLSKYAMRMALKKEVGEIQQWLNKKTTLLCPLMATSLSCLKKQ